MKSIALCFGGLELLDPPLDTPLLDGYLELGMALQKHGVQLFIVRGLATYLGGNSFSGGGICRDGKLEPYPHRIDADLIYNKSIGFCPDRTANMIDSKDFEILYSHKLYMARMFPHLFPQTLIVQKPVQVRPIIDLISTDTVVAKPLDSYGGSGVIIGSKDHVANQITKFPYLLQEFIDTSAGIPGLTRSTSDLRVIVTGIDDAWKIILMYYREPAQGKFVTNLSQGGSIIPVPEGKWPEDAIDLAREVDRDLRCFRRRIYCLDCARASDGRWIIYEFNVPPGQMTRAECGPEADRYFDGVVELLVASL